MIEVKNRVPEWDRALPLYEKKNSCIYDNIASMTDYKTWIEIG